jgi:hypothetical protein
MPLGAQVISFVILSYNFVLHMLSFWLVYLIALLLKATLSYIINTPN